MIHKKIYFCQIKTIMKECLCIIEYNKTGGLGTPLRSYAVILDSKNEIYKLGDAYRFDKFSIIAEVDKNDTLVDMEKKYPEYFL